MQYSVDLPSGRIKLVLPEGVHKPPESTVELARLLDLRRGDRVLELGCGSGLLSIAAARAGAARVVAVDIDLGALEATAANAQRNGLAGVIDTRRGWWYDALDEDDQDSFDLIVAIPPQTPGAYDFGPRYGGRDGTDHLRAVIHGAPAYLRRDRGRVWILAISLAHTTRVLKELEQRFSDVQVVKMTERTFTAGEYENLATGLFEHLKTLQNAGTAEFYRQNDGSYTFVNRFIRAGACRKP